MIITIGREFGSGGHEIGEKLAERLGIHLYDRKMVDEVAKEKGFDVETIAQHEEKPRNHFFSRRVRGYSNSMEDIVAEIQFEFIRDKAESGESFVVVGRCAESILDDRDDVISIFILGDEEEKIKRVMDIYNLDRDDAIKKMERHDRKRKRYHNAHSKNKWGDSRGYDLCINSSRLNTEKAVDLIADFVEMRK